MDEHDGASRTHAAVVCRESVTFTADPASGHDHPAAAARSARAGAAAGPARLHPTPAAPPATSPAAMGWSRRLAAHAVRNIARAIVSNSSNKAAAARWGEKHGEKLQRCQSAIMMCNICRNIRAQLYIYELLIPGYHTSEI